jgi:hypothetical protein
LLVPRIVQKVARATHLVRRAPRVAGDWRGGATITLLLTQALHLETALSGKLANAGIDLPGLSWWALCAKQSS